MNQSDRNLQLHGVFMKYLWFSLSSLNSSILLKTFELVTSLIFHTLHQHPVSWFRHRPPHIWNSCVGGVCQSAVECLWKLWGTKETRCSVWFCLPGPQTLVFVSHTTGTGSVVTLTCHFTCPSILPAQSYLFRPVCLSCNMMLSVCSRPLNLSAAQRCSLFKIHASCVTMYCIYIGLERKNENNLKVTMYVMKHEPWTEICSRREDV